MYRYLLPLLSPYWKWILLAISLAVLTILANVGLMAVSAYLIATCALHPPLYTLFLMITAVRFFGISKGVFRYAERYVSHDATLRILTSIRLSVYKQIEPLVPAIYNTKGNFDFFDTLMHEVEVLQNFFVKILQPTVAMSIVPLAVAFFFYFFNFEIFFVYLFFYMFIIFLSGNLIWRLSLRRGKEISLQKKSYHRELWYGIRGLRDLISFGIVGRFQSISTDKGLLYSGLQKEQQLLIHGAGNIFQFAIHALVWLLLIIAISSRDEGNLNPKMLPVVVLMALSSFEAYTQWLQSLPFMHEVKVAVEGLRGYDTPKMTPQSEIGKSDEEKHEKRSGRKYNKETRGDEVAPCIKETLPQSLSFDRVSFSYDDEIILQGISFTLSRGDLLVIMGHSGAGKSSLINLLLKFWEPKGGDIQIDEVSLKDIDTERNSLYSYVGHWNHIFNDTVRNNLRIAAPRLEDKEYIKALEKVGLGRWLAGFEDGLDGYMGEDGQKLSGGERKRFFITQAMLKNGPIWLLDEPGESLDEGTEKKVVGLLGAALKDKISIIVSHSPAFLPLATHLLILEKGRIKEFRRL